MIEANACGLPVIASRRPGLRDSVKDGETGHLVEYGDVSGFAAKAVELLTDAEKWARMSAAAVEWFLHADQPVEQQAGRYLLGPKAVRLAVDLKAPAGAAVTTGPTVLMAPGKPGSITSGEQQQRGYELKVTTAPATVTRIDATLTVVK